MTRSFDFLASRKQAEEALLEQKKHRMLDKGIIVIEKPVTPSKLFSKISEMLDA